MGHGAVVPISSHPRFRMQREPEESARLVLERLEELGLVAHGSGGLSRRSTTPEASECARTADTEAEAFAQTPALPAPERA